jgi:pimeloyl-ACP methyl ester carboxylesterase
VADPVLIAVSELVPGVRRGELRRDGRSLRWIEAGAASPPVVMVAGLGEPASLTWAGVLAPVSAQTRIVAYDRAGTGASDPASSLTLDDQVEDLVAVLASCSDDACVVAGHSWGGLLAQVVSWRYPDLIAGLVLADPADERFSAALPDEQRQQGREMDRMILDLHARGELSPMIRSMFQPFTEKLTASPRIREQLLAACESCYARDTQVHSLPGERRLFASSLPQIAAERAATGPPRIPVTILSASKGMPVEFRQKLTSVHAQLAATPSGRHIVLADTGHAINEERPESVAHAITSMIASIRASM